MLKLIATTAGAELERLEGHYAVERIEPFVTRVRNLLTEGERRGRSAQAAAQVRVVLADSLFTLGDQSDRNEYLAEAIAAYRAALEEHTRERVPLRWAATQNNLGNALAELGEREPGTERLEEAVAAYRAALTVFREARSPLHTALRSGPRANRTTARA